MATQYEPVYGMPPRDCIPFAYILDSSANGIEGVTSSRDKMCELIAECDCIDSADTVFAVYLTPEGDLDAGKYFADWFYYGEVRDG